MRWPAAAVEVAAAVPQQTAMPMLISFLLITLIHLQPSAASSIQQHQHQHQNNNNNSHQQQQLAFNYLLFSSSAARQHLQQEPKLAELLKDSNHNHVGDAVNLQLANQVWHKMRHNALEFVQQRANQSRPAIIQLLEDAQVGGSCRRSLSDLIDHIAKLEQWAMQMYNSFGDFPAPGLFEGSLTSMGSYHQCVDLEPNEVVGRPQYCTFKFQPIVPKRPKFHNILAPIEGLANFTSKDDMFNQLARKAQYFYYAKLRLATCMPSKCDKGDLERLGKQVALNTYLQYSGVSCLEKQEGFNLDGAQLFALTILISLASISLLGTIVHLLNLRAYLLLRRQSCCPSDAASYPASEDTSSDLSANLFAPAEHNNGKSQVVIQQQSLLVAASQQQQQQQQQHKSTNIILPQPVIIQTAGANNNNNNNHTSSSSSSVNSGLQRNYSQLIYIVEVLLHFSIIRNGRKLFDTSTSRRASSRASSMAPGMKEMSNLSSAPSSQASDTSSVMNGTTTSKSNDISCVHGLRFWTISWIIFGHTMQYTEWAGFARAYQVEKNIVSFFLQPLLNATFSVDTFFLISGLLTTYVTWSMTKGQYRRFNKFAFLISRYLRLTPQVLLVILLFIVFPLMGDGPYWRGMIQKESDNCKTNWWVNALYLQAFIKQDNICNLVTWWLSIEMFYHFVSIFVIIALLHSARKGMLTALAIGGSLTAYSCYLHYVNQYPPNMLPTLLQRYEVWDSIVLKYFWTPYPHAASYFVGLMLGYVLYSRSVGPISRTQVRWGWFAFAVSYLTILFGTYNWNNNAPYSRFASTAYYNLSQVFWSLATAWLILACAYGHGGWLNKFLSSPVFVPLGRATYMTYLSHMIIVMSYPAKMNLLIEPSYVVFLYIFISNLFLSYLLGIVLTLVYESPVLHLQKILVRDMAMKFNEETSSPQPTCHAKLSSNDKVEYRKQG